MSVALKVFSVVLEEIDLLVGKKFAHDRRALCIYSDQILCDSIHDCLKYDILSDEFKALEYKKKKDMFGELYDKFEYLDFL